MKRTIEIDRNDAKNIWWDWFVTNKKYWPHGLTYAKLNRTQAHIWHDNELWYDLLNRHSMIDKFPWKAKIDDKENYDHAIAGHDTGR
jgi:hypothetical protein